MSCLSTKRMIQTINGNYYKDIYDELDVAHLQRE